MSVYSRCCLVLESIWVQGHGIARNACTALYFLIYLVKGSKGFISNKRRCVVLNGHRPAPTNNRLAKLRRSDRIGVNYSTFFNLRLWIVVGVSVIQHSTAKNRLDTLKVHSLISDRHGVKAVRYGLTRDIYEWVFVLPHFPIQKLTSTMVPSVIRLDCLSYTIIVDVHLNVTLEDFH